MLTSSRVLARIARIDERTFVGSLFTSGSRLDPTDANKTVPTKSQTGTVTEKGRNDKPVKFTTSEAHLNYRSVRNFYGDDSDLPPSHNQVLAGTLISAIFYLIYLRDDIEGGGGKDLLKPVHEQVPELAIPLLQTAIAENRKFGNDTKKLEMKLAEYMKNPEKYGIKKRTLVDN